MGSGTFAGGLIMPGTSLGVRFRLRSFGRGLEQVQDPAWFSAGSEMSAQEYLLGAWPRAGTSLVQGRDRDVGSIVFVRG